MVAFVFGDLKLGKRQTFCVGVELEKKKKQTRFDLINKTKKNIIEKSSKYIFIDLINDFIHSYTYMVLIYCSRI